MKPLDVALRLIRSVAQLPRAPQLSHHELEPVGAAIQEELADVEAGRGADDENLDLDAAEDRRESSDQRGAALRTNYVLIDYENVQPSMLAALEAEHFKVIVFVGASQTKIGIEAAVALQRMGEKAAYVKISGNGPNTLDFHIAFYIGHFAALDPTAYFHVISKDTGFDPLIQHLKTKKVFASRWRDVGEIPLLKVKNASSPPPERLAAIADRLRRFGSAKPASVKTLSSTIHSMHQKQLSEQEVATLVEQLQKAGWIKVEGTKLSYSLPG